MQISQTGIDLIKRFEGCRLHAYRDAVGVITIGYGWTKAIDGKALSMSTTITQAQADRLLVNGLKSYENNVLKYNTVYHWTQNEFDALVSFAYNIGSIDQLTGRGTRTKAQIAASMLNYNKAGGCVLLGLTKRRNAEHDLFCKVVNDEMVEKAIVIVNGQKCTVDRILKDGTNYIKIRDIAAALGYTISSTGSTPVLTKK